MDWKIERRTALERARRIVVKVGSAVLTTHSVLDQAMVDSLADQIARLHDRGLDIVLVSSGAVAAGRGVIATRKDLCSGKGLCARSGLAGMPARQAASAIGQSRLMYAYDMAFDRHGKVTAQILLTKDDFKSNRRFLNACNTFDSLLAWRVVPIVNENDTVVVAELEFGDNDSLASLLLNLVGADLFVNLTSASGVYAANPDNPSDLPPVPMDVIEDIASLDLDVMCGGKTSVGSGGMYSKLVAARRAAQIGVPTLIVSGREPDALYRAVTGEALGTWVVPDSKTISRRKFRMAYNTEPAGSVTVDEGAVRALAERGKSLLAAGITAVDGNFGRGALIRILTPGGHTLGVGLSNYKAVDLRRIMGRKTADIESLLGYAYDEAIHRDNLLLDAALKN
ncbi:MAG: glutamate 5-kinase [Desulfovibrionaceae bacterium]